MIKMAIVEDEDKEAERLISCLKRYEKEKGESFLIERYYDAFSFLETEEKYDVAFMDIMLPQMNGMDAAFRLRKFDTSTVLIFVTNMTQFAIKSYEVDALDYILKPVSYERVTFKLNKVLDVLQAKKTEILSLKTDKGFVRINTNQIYYIEIRAHRLTYKTDMGDFEETGTMKAVEEKLKDFHFMRCNSCYLVNPAHVVLVKGTSISMRNGDELVISQPKRKAFMNDFTNYLGQMKC